MTADYLTKGQRDMAEQMARITHLQTAARWETWKAVAALISAAAAFMGAGAAIYAIGQHNAERPAAVAPAKVAP